MRSIHGVCAAFLVAVAVIVAGCGGGGARSTDPAGWNRCTSAHNGFSLAYPGNWHVASLHRLGVPGASDAYRHLFFTRVVCVNYDPNPFTVIDGSEYPTTAVQVFRSPTPQGYHQAIRWKFDVRSMRTIERRAVVVGGHPAIRYHVYTKAGGGLWDRSHVYGYVIDFGRKGAIDIQAWRYGFKPIPWTQYRANMAIVDRMAPTARVVATS